MNKDSQCSTSSWTYFKIVLDILSLPQVYYTSMSPTYISQLDQYGRVGYTTYLGVTEPHYYPLYYTVLVISRKPHVKGSQKHPQVSRVALKVVMKTIHQPESTRTISRRGHKLRQSAKLYWKINKCPKKSAICTTDTWNVEPTMPTSGTLSCKV